METSTENNKGNNSGVKGRTIDLDAIVINADSPEDVHEQFGLTDADSEAYKSAGAQAVVDSIKEFNGKFNSAHVLQKLLKTVDPKVVTVLALQVLLDHINESVGKSGLFSQADSEQEEDNLSGLPPELQALIKGLGTKGANVHVLRVGK